MYLCNEGVSGLRKSTPNMIYILEIAKIFGCDFVTNSPWDCNMLTKKMHISCQGFEIKCEATWNHYLPVLLYFRMATYLEYSEVQGVQSSKM